MAGNEIKALFEEFVAKAKRFMADIESVKTVSRNEFLSRLQRSLADLYALGIRLPVIEFDTETDLPESLRRAGSVWLDPIRNTLKERDRYWEVFDPTKKDEPNMPSLADELTDIYSDVKEGLAIPDYGGSVAEALWTLQLSFISHWGFHAIDALRAIHWLVYHLGKEASSDIPPKSPDRQ